MITEVIKKDGTKVPFDVEKVKSAIVGAASVTDLSEERKIELVNQITSSLLLKLEGKTEVATTEIRETVLAELDSIEPSVSAAWRQYEKDNE